MKLEVSPVGAQVLRWAVDGIDHLYLSPKADLSGAAAIRGGVPICFPQFNLRQIGPHRLPKHGFARTAAWQTVRDQASEQHSLVEMQLRDSAATRAMWPHSFIATALIQADSKQLKVSFSLQNTGAEPFDFALALHTYLGVDNIHHTQLHGLQQVPYWDAVADLQHPERRKTDTAPVSFGAETDRVYAHAARGVRVTDGQKTLHITASPSLPDVVVWNPGEHLCAKLADVPADGWQHMLCVEAAAIEQPVRLLPGARWQGWQRIEVQAV